MENQRQIKVKYASVVPQNFQRYLSVTELSVTLLTILFARRTSLYVMLLCLVSPRSYDNFKKGNLILPYEYTIYFQNS